MNPPGAKLLVSRCFNHADREASARCTVCGRFHCRECVAEHDGRMICGACLRKEKPVEDRPAGRWVARLGQAARLFAAVVVAWFVFYAAGRIMLMAPSEFHEGTLWKGGWWQDEQK